MHFHGIVIITLMLTALPPSEAAMRNIVDEPVAHPADRLTALQHHDTTMLSPAVMEVDEVQLLADPVLLLRAILAAAHRGNWPALQALLPVYEMSAHADLGLLDQLRLLLQRATDRSAAAPPLAQQWVLQGRASLRHERNINNAPRLRRIGGWTFAPPIDDRLLAWGATAQRHWLFADTGFASLAAEINARHYFRHWRHNSLHWRISPALGTTGASSTVQAGPFISYRRHGERPYARAAGAHLEWTRWWTPTLQTRAGMEFGRQRHEAQRRHLDHRSYSAHLALTYKSSPSGLAMLAVDTYRQWGTHDAQDMMTGYGLAAAWMQQRRNGLSLRLQGQALLRRHHGPSLLSSPARRQDRMLGVALSVWHRDIAYAGFTPRLIFSHQHMHSNDPLYTWRKRDVTLEAARTF